MPAGTVIRRAHAKLNLALAVGPPEGAGSERPGWHRIASWSCAVALADEVRVRRLPEGAASTWSFACAPDAPRRIAFDWPVASDLTFRAHALLEREAGRPLPVAIAVTKRIPPGGGLGGGSSDAAGVMLALDDLFGLGLGADRLRALSAAIGSDVAFFIDEAGAPRPALVTGFADRVERVAPVRAGVVLVVPGFGCATPAVYKAFDALHPGPMREREVAEMARAGRAVGAALFNDLAEAAFALHSALRSLRERASRAIGRPVHLTGSGSTLFALCEPEEASALGERTARALAGAAVVATEIVG
ncbi:MAG: hypothetical protein KJZ54_03555 [Phycisphaerales bacterium]|nr:hypothetical protein [Phycisphaerales bacterium]